MAKDSEKKPLKEEPDLNNFDMFIVSKYFENVQDFINLAKTNKYYQGIIDIYDYNPINVNKSVMKVFDKMEVIDIHSKKELRLFYRRKRKPKLRLCMPVERDWYRKLLRNFTVVSNVGFIDSYHDLRQDTGKVIRFMDGDTDISNTIVREIDPPPGKKNVPYPRIVSHQCLRLNTPETLTRINDYAFYGSFIQYLTLPNTFQEFGRCSFLCCWLTAVNVPPSVREIPYGCFAGCHLEELILPNVNKIDDFGIYNNESLTRLEIGPDLREMSEVAIANNTQLLPIIIPTTVRILPIKQDKDQYRVVTLSGIRDDPCGMMGGFIYRVTLDWIQPPFILEKRTKDVIINL